MKRIDIILQAGADLGFACTARDFLSGMESILPGASALPLWNEEVNEEKRVILSRNVSSILRMKEPPKQNNPAEYARKMNDLFQTDQFTNAFLIGSFKVLAAENLHYHAKDRQVKTTPRFDRAELRKMGQRWFERGYRYHLNDDKLAITAMVQSTRHNPALHALIAFEPAMVQAINLGRWVRFGMPIVRFDRPNYAAALMSTTVPSGIIVVPPWGTFVIEMPAKLVTLWNTSGEKGCAEDVAYVTACYLDRYPGRDPYWMIDAITLSGVYMYRNKVSMEQLIHHTSSDMMNQDKESFDGLISPLTDMDARAMVLISRLVLGTCLAMTQPGGVTAISKNASWPDDIRQVDRDVIERTSEEPCEPRVYQIGQPVRIDCREKVREYMTGERKNPLNVQFMVHGHWKQQPCGPQNADRKTIFVQPYWKGASDAPILLRDHVVVGES